MRIFSVRPAAVDCQRIGQPLSARQLLGEVRGRLPPLGLAQLLGQGELHLAVEPPVSALVFVRRLPVFCGVGPRPLRHVSVLDVLQFLDVLLVLSFAPDVIALGARRQPAGAGTEAHFQVLNRHAATPLASRFSARRFMQVKRNSAPFSSARVFLPPPPRRFNLIHLPARCYHLASHAAATRAPVTAGPPGNPQAGAQGAEKRAAGCPAPPPRQLQTPDPGRPSPHLRRRSSKRPPIRTKRSLTGSRRAMPTAPKSFCNCTSDEGNNF